MSKRACQTTSTIRQDTFININLRWWGTKMGRQRQVNRCGAVPQVIAVIEDQLQSISTTFKYVIITTVLVFKFFSLTLRVIRLHTIWLLLLFIYSFIYLNIVMLIFLILFRLYTTGGRERTVDERLNIARIYVGRAPRRVSKNFNLHEFTYDGSKILKGFTHFIPNKQFLKPSLISTLFFLKQESALPSLWSANLYRTRSAPCIKKFQLARIYIRWFQNS